MYFLSNFKKYTANPSAGLKADGRPNKPSVCFRESWLSGLRHLTANEAGTQVPRGFKSHTLRSYKNELHLQGVATFIERRVMTELLQSFVGFEGRSYVSVATETSETGSRNFLADELKSIRDQIPLLIFCQFFP